MQATAIEHLSIELDRRKPAETNVQPSLMTPARRAGLDALEREFNEFLRRRRS
jgi:hypothetical protein